MRRLFTCVCVCRPIAAIRRRMSSLAGLRAGRVALVVLATLFQATIGVSVTGAQTSGERRPPTFGEWRAPVSLDPDRTIGINTPFNDGCPYEAPGGNALYFATDRSGNLDVWSASRVFDNTWHLKPLPSPVNTVASEFCPTPLPGHQLLFVSTRANNCGGTGPNADIYYTRRDHKGNWEEPRPLSCDINSGGAEFSPSLVEAEGRTMLFFSSDRSAPGKHRIYVSVLEHHQMWRAAEEVVELNAPGFSDARPNVRKDGLEIVWDSTRDGGPSQIYTATRSSIFEPWSDLRRVETCLPGGRDGQDCINDPSQAQSRASLSGDGTRLYFGSTRANKTLGGAGSDIYLATRSVAGKGRHKEKEEP